MDRQEQYQKSDADGHQLPAVPEDMRKVSSERSNRYCEPVQFFECSTSAEIEEFIVLRNQLPESHRLMLTQYTLEQYKQQDAKLFLADNKGGGYGILAGGEIVSVFSLPGHKLGRAIIENAILRGGKRVECFDINNKLPEIYQQFGFVEKGRMAWDYSEAPSNWDYEKYDTPDIVMMELNFL